MRPAGRSQAYGAGRTFIQPAPHAVCSVLWRASCPYLEARRFQSLAGQLKRPQVRDLRPAVQSRSHALGRRPSARSRTRHAPCPAAREQHSHRPPRKCSSQLRLILRALRRRWLASGAAGEKSASSRDHFAPGHTRRSARFRHGRRALRTWARIDVAGRGAFGGAGGRRR